MYLDRILKPSSPLFKFAPNPILGAAFGAGASLVGSFVNYNSQQNVNKVNLQLAKQQNDWNERMWHKNNAYNSPAAQKERMLQAGINPLGQDFTPVASQPVQSADLSNQQPPQVDAGALGNSFSQSYQNYLLGKKVDSEIDLNKAAGFAALMKGKNDAEDTITKSYFNKFAQQLYGANADAASSNAFILQQKASFAGTREYQEIRKTMSETERNHEDAEMLKLQRKIFPAKAAAEIKRDLSQANLSDQQAREISEMLGLKKTLTRAQINTLIAGVYKTAQEISVLDQDKFSKALETYLKATGSDFKFGNVDLGKLLLLIRYGGFSPDKFAPLNSPSFTNPLPDDLYKIE